MRSMRWIMCVTAGLLGPGCAGSHGAAPELLECPASPYDGDRALWRYESPARGRIWACEACARSEEEILARAVELRCRLEAAHEACTLTGACDYAAQVAWEEGVRTADGCDELAALASADPCLRPDPRVYWRPEGD
jgi:hypothetical protein